jgi:hypothetical protein
MILKDYKQRPPFVPLQRQLKKRFMNEKIAIKHCRSQPFRVNITTCYH